MEPVTQDARLVKRAYWLIKIRWFAIVCVGIGTYFSSVVLGIELQDLALYGIVILLAVYNMTVLLLLNHFTRSNREMPVSLVKRIINFQMYADLILLTIILHFSGGIENPFVLYFIFHMIIASILLSVRESYFQATFAVLLFGLLLLSEYLQLIPHHCLKGFVEQCLHGQGLYNLGTFFVFATSLYLVVYMTSYIAVRLRQAEQALRASRDFMGRIFNGMHDGLVVVDRDFEIKDVNGRFLEQCGVARDEAIGSKCYKISHHADEPCSGPGHICPVIRVFDTAEIVRLEHTHIDSATDPHFVELSAFPLFAADGSVEAVVELSHDITERKRGERALMQANVSLKEKDRIKDEYVLRVTHDIKGHLATIRSWLYMATEKSSDLPNEKRSEFSGRALDRTHQVTDFVGKLLNLTHMRISGRLQMEAFSLPDCISRALDAVANKAKEKSITVSSKAGPSLGPVIGNEFSINEMITNLLFNAIKYTPEKRTVHLEAREHNDRVTIDIRDTGIGIPEHEIGKIFDEFFRASNARESKRDGTGLGLAIVRQVVDRHGGKISVQSRQGHGTTFTVTLPRDGRTKHSKKMPSTEAVEK